MHIDQILRFAIENGASDIHLQVGYAPHVRMGGQVRAVDSPALTDELMKEYIRAIGPQSLLEDLGKSMRQGADFAYSMPDGSRFRCNFYSHLGTPALVIRVITAKVRTIEELRLPSVIEDLALVRRGILLMSGATGSGKSTTLASIIDLLNRSFYLKILTIEDPIEYLHTGKKSLVSHVEIGRDTPTFEHGLRQAMRQTPDVILVGELRDAETVQMALRAADTGHQVLTTIHASNAAQTIERLFAMVPSNYLSIARQQLAASLVGIVSQRLVVGKKGGLLPVVEVLRSDSIVSKYIMEDRILDLMDYIATEENGMQSFDSHLLRLVFAGAVDGVQALEVASNPESLALKIRQVQKPK